MNALIVEDCDNVAVAIEAIPSGTEISYATHDGGVRLLKAAEDIPAYHKLAVVPIPAGSDIVKYGERIGLAACDIPLGAHVHVHNVQNLS